MPGEREELLNDLTGNDQPSDEHQVTDVQEVDHGNDADDQAEQDEGREAVVTPMSGKEAASLLDSLTDGPDQQPKGEPATEAAEVEAQEKPDADAAPDQKTIDEQEAEALEGVKSERGKERIKAVFAERRELEARATELETDINEFKGMIQSTGMGPDEFTQMLEVGRLLKSGSEGDLKLALQHIDTYRETVCKQLGIEAPGVDALGDFPDLKQKVDNMEITKETALELAKFKRAEQQQQRVAQAQQSQQQDLANYKQEIGEVSQVAERYFATREKEADYPVKIAMLSARFKDPQFMQEFVATYQPKQWFSVIKMMYDSTVVPAAPREATPQPLRNRVTHTGKPAPSADAPLSDRIGSHLDSMGI
jgi:hypothetical protein